jgi:LmbE family N-acetylglucosaminyl deacetylase
MNILAIAPHPDDLEIGCGGALLKYARGGASITALVMSDGALGGDVPTRRREQENAAKLLGIEELIWGGFEDGDLPSDRVVIDRIEEVMKRVNPRFMFAPYPDDTHQDHRQISNAALSAARYTRNMLFYETPTSVGFDPTTFVDIEETLAAKLEALQAHVSQVERTNIEGIDITAIARSMALFRGTQSRVKYAEGFRPVRLFINL